MPLCYFVSDLHGHLDRYLKLFHEIRSHGPAAVFLGGDLLPHRFKSFLYKGQAINNFIIDFLEKEFQSLKMQMGNSYPEIFLILGNDDPRSEEQYLFSGEEKGLWKYIHNKKVSFGEYTIYGYAYIPPTPFFLKDWERYDVSLSVAPGCIDPTQGKRTIETDEKIEYETIESHLNNFANGNSFESSVFLFHSPPYKSELDRAALDNKSFEGVPLDLNVGSIAIKRFIEEKQPKITLHGHIHESVRLTGKWKELIGNTFIYGAAHDGPELVLIKFNPDEPGMAAKLVI